MDFQTLGVLLYRTREKKHLSLLDVCSGICSQSTLSRVEQGSRDLQVKCCLAESDVKLHALN